MGVFGVPVKALPALGLDPFDEAGFSRRGVLSGLKLAAPMTSRSSK
jgi:hypothetical protein